MQVSNPSGHSAAKGWPAGKRRASPLLVRERRRCCSSESGKVAPTADTAKIDTEFARLLTDSTPVRSPRRPTGLTLRPFRVEGTRGEDDNHDGRYNRTSPFCSLRPGMNSESRIY